MNNKQALDWGQRYLESHSIATARLDALVLLEDNSKLDRARLLAEPEESIEEAALKSYKKQVRSRAKHFPLAYIRQKTEFYGREFRISKDVLEPRPESESLIEELKQLARKKGSSVIDVGTGSGALIITAKLEMEDIDAFATDISAACLKLAAINASTYGCKISFSEANLLSSLAPEVLNKDSVIIANLPYVPEGWQINPPAMREPKIAIFGGSDGLDIYRRLFKQVSGLREAPKWILTEAMPPQHEALASIALSSEYELFRSNDFIQVFKSSSSQA